MIKLNKTMLLMGLVVLFLMTGLYYGLFYQKTANKLHGVESSLAQKQTTLNTTLRIIQNRTPDTTGTGQVDASGNLPLPRIPDEESIISTLIQLGQATSMRIVGVSFTGSDDNSPNSAAGGAQNANSSAAGNAGEQNDIAKRLAETGVSSVFPTIKTISLELSLSGSLPNMKRFADLLQQEQRIYQISSLSYTGTGGAAAAQPVPTAGSAFRLQVSAYYDQLPAQTPG
jgi:hypothetical protein